MVHRVLLLAIAGCSTHHRLIVGPTIGAREATTGAEITGEAAGGDEGGLMLVAAGTGRLGHELSGGGFRFGAQLNKGPRPWGGALSISFGPTFTDNRGETEARFEARGGFAVYYGLISADDPYKGMNERTTIGVEVFASSIGIDDNEVLLGIGLSFGSYHGHERSPLMARARVRHLVVAGP